MISIPQGGWTNVEIGSFRDRTSYITDVPVDFLQSMISALRDKSFLFAAHCDAEGWEYYILSHRYDTYIISYRNVEDEYDSLDEPNVIVENVGIKELARQLIIDISSDIGGWAEWGACDPQELDERNRFIISLLAELKQLV